MTEIQRSNEQSIQFRIQNGNNVENDILVHLSPSDPLFRDFVSGMSDKSAEAYVINGSTEKLPTSQYILPLNTPGSREIRADIITHICQKAMQPAVEEVVFIHNSQSYDD